MNDVSKERVSALADGEVTSTETRDLVAEFKRNSELGEKWNRYHIIRSAIKKDLPDQLQPSLADRVQSALESEPVILAPRRIKKSSRSFVKQAAGLGIAASLVAVAVLSLDQWLGKPVGVDSSMVAERTVSPQQSKTVLAQQPDSDANRLLKVRMNPYVVDHSQYATRVGMKPTMRIMDIASDKVEK